MPMDGIGFEKNKTFGKLYFKNTKFWGFEVPHFRGMWGQIEILSTYNLLCRKIATPCLFYFWIHDAADCS